MKNERLQPVVFAECGCRLDLAGKKLYEGTLCKFHEKVVSDRIFKKLVFGDENVETGK